MKKIMLLHLVILIFISVQHKSSRLYSHKPTTVLYWDNPAGKNLTFNLSSKVNFYSISSLIKIQWATAQLSCTPGSMHIVSGLLSHTVLEHKGTINIIKWGGKFFSKRWIFLSFFFTPVIFRIVIFSHFSRWTKTHKGSDCASSTVQPEV